MKPAVDGILVLNKPAGPTSHDVVQAVRRIVSQRSVGHAGTLDPAAEGVLVVCVGKATRVVECLAQHDKLYHAEIVLGVSTDTYDAQGRITAQAERVSVSEDQLRQALDTFRGSFWQSPPPYSALKRGGVPLYRAARAGRPIEVAPRLVTVYTLDILEWRCPVVQIRLRCSKGTYIRSLAHDLGQKLGCGAHLRRLVRLGSGPFTLEGAITLEELEAIVRDGNWEKVAYPVDEVLLCYPALILGPESSRRTAQGLPRRPVVAPEGNFPPRCRAYSTDGRFLAIMEWQASRGCWQPKKVFA